MATWASTLLSARFRRRRTRHTAPQVGPPAAPATQAAYALRAVPLFQEVPDGDLATIWPHLQEVRLAAGTVVCRRGEPGDRFYIIREGAAEVRLGLGPDGLAIRRLAAGDFFGEMALLADTTRTADVVVVEDAALWALDRADFEALTSGSKSLLRALSRTLCQRLALATASLEDHHAAGAGAVAGLRFGSYRVVEQIGSGGMGAVYSAIHHVTGTAAAVKVLPAAWGAHPELHERLRREAAVLRRVNHPHVIRVLEVGQVEARYGGGCYLAMEWLPHALDRVLRAHESERLSLEQALALAQGVAEALAAVHASGLIHRDVKPSNILLRADGSPVLTDFGLAAHLREVAHQQRLTPTDIVLGTADYVSPEHVAGAPVDGRSDVYSLGVVLYELLAGRTPFAGRDAMSTLLAHCDTPPPPLPDTVPPDVRALVERTLQKRPEDRYPSAAALADALAAARAGL